MAGDIDTKLVLQLTADIKSLQRSLKAANDDTKRTTDSISKSFSTVNTTVARTAAQIDKSMQNSTRNLSFQFQDIATQLLSGQSPFTIAAQQASQAGDAINELRRSGGLLKGLGGALAGVFNPATLGVAASTIAFGFLFDAAQRYFTETEEGSKLSSEEIGKQIADIKKLAEAWDNDATPALKQYFANLTRVAEGAEKVAKARETLAKIFEPVQKTVKELSGQVADIQSQLQTADWDKFAQLSTDLGRAFEAVRKKVEANQPATQEMLHLNELILQAQQSGIVAVTQFGDKVRNDLNPGLRETVRLSDEVAKSLQSMQFGPWRMSAPSDFNPLSPLSSSDVMGSILRDNERAAASARDLASSLGEASSEITDFVNDVIQAESGGRANARNAGSSASGYGGFIDSTWLSTFKRVFAAEAAGMSDAAILALKSDLDTNRTLIRAYAQENAKALLDAGQTVNQASLQLAHFLGAGGAIKVLQAQPGTRIADIPGMGAAVRANPSILGGGATREDAIAHATRRTQANVAEKKSLDDLMLSKQDQLELDQKILAIQADSSLKEEEKLFAIDKLRASTQLLNEAEAAGIALDAKKRAEIDALATSIANQERQERQLAAAQKEAKQAAEDLRTSQKQARDVAVNLVETGLSSFISQLRQGASAADALKAALDDVLSVMINLAIRSIATGIGKALFPTAHRGLHGGTRDMRSVSPAIFAGAPRLHSGLNPGEFPAILQQGERVIPRSVVRRGGSQGNRDVNSHNNYGDITVNVPGQVVASNEDARDLGRQIDAAVQSVLVREKRSGGLLRS